MNKKIRNDIVLIGILSLTAVAAGLSILLNAQKKGVTASVYVQNKLVERIDLSKKENKYYYVQGTHTLVTIHTHDGAIAVVDGNCPHHDCENQGYVSQCNIPIVCAYNGLYIEISGVRYDDVRAG